MIALSCDFLLFTLANGESVPFSPDVASITVDPAFASRFDPEFVKQAAHAVFHYFKHELGRHTVTVGEFAGAMEKVLGGFSPAVQVEDEDAATKPVHVKESDLAVLARESGTGGELFFFPRLREEFRRQAQRSPSFLRFSGAREAARHLAGTRRWSIRCQKQLDQIVAFLRQCLTAEAPPNGSSLLVH